MLGVLFGSRANGDASVAIRTFQFAPDTLRVKAGTRVVWSNADEIEHTITSGSPEKRDGPFHGVVDRRGATYSAVLERAQIMNMVEVRPRHVEPHRLGPGREQKRAICQMLAVLELD